MKPCIIAALLHCMAAVASAATGRVVGVSDGDTITVLTAAQERLRIRLAEIDAPESAQAFGARAKQSLSGICFGKTATFTRASTDRYGRVVSRVYCDGVDAQTHQVENGLAWVYGQYVQDRSLYRIQRQARRDKRGLWSDPRPIAPWNFRRHGS